MYQLCIRLRVSGAWTWIPRASGNCCSKPSSWQLRPRPCPSCPTSNAIFRRSSRLERGCALALSHGPHRTQPMSKRESASVRRFIHLFIIVRIKHDSSFTNNKQFLRIVFLLLSFWPSMFVTLEDFAPAFISTNFCI